MLSRYFAFVIVMLLDLTACDGPVVPSDPQPPDFPSSVASAYQRDAARLALRDVTLRQPIQEAPIELPAEAVEGYERALAWLYHSSSAARDTVVDLYRIHAWPAPELHEIVVTVDATHPWTTRWRQRQALTGNPAVDQLVIQHELQVLSWQSTSASAGSALLSTPLNLNAAALGKSFEGIPGVRGGYPNTKGGAGDDLLGEQQSGAWFLTFSRGWGDCFLGCLHRHSWRFRVTAEGVVEFLESDGPPVPSGPGT